MPLIEEVMRLVTVFPRHNKRVLEVAFADSGRLGVAGADSFKGTFAVKIASVGSSVDNHRWA